MKPNELSQLGYDTDGYDASGDYVPDVETSGKEPQTDFVYRAYLQLQQLNQLGGVKALGGSAERQDAIYAALEDAVDLISAVERFGDEDQRQQARHLIAAGKVSS